MIPLVNVTPVPNPSNTIHACSLMRTVPNIDAGHRVPLSSEPRAVARLHLRDAKGNERTVPYHLNKTDFEKFGIHI